MGTSRKYKNNEITKPRRIMGLALLTGSFLGVWLALSGSVMGQVDSFSPYVNEQFVEVATGRCHSLALRSDGTVAAWGNNPNGQCDVPALPRGLTYVEVSAGGTADEMYFYEDYGFSLARRSDGTVVAWGDNSFGQLNVPTLPPGLTYVEIAAGSNHALARRSDGSVRAWGDNTYGQCKVPTLPPGLTYVEISAGGWTEEWIDDSMLWFPVYLTWHRGHSVARRSDGSVVVWGDNTHGQKSVPILPPGVTFVEVAAGSDHTVARLSDGSIVAWGDNTFGQCDVTTVSFPGLMRYVAIDAGGGHTMALRSDGWLMTWGNAPDAGVVPPLPAGMTYVAMAVGGNTDHWEWESHWVFDFGAYAYSHTLAIRSDGRILGWGSNYYGQANSP